LVYVSVSFIVFCSLALLLVAVMALVSLRRDRGKLRTAAALGLSLALYMVGANIQARWVFFIASTLLAATLASCLAARLTVAGLAVERSSPRRVTEGEVAEVGLRVRNRGKRGRGAFLVTDYGWKRREGADGAAGRGGKAWAALARRRSLLAGEPARGGSGRDGAAPLAPAAMDDGVPIFVPRLEAGEELGLKVPRLFPRRGVHRGGWVELRCGGRLGLASSLRRVEMDAEVVVLPRYEELPGLPGMEGMLSPRQPRRERRPSGHSTDFYGVREYRRGDPLRYVHWKASARLGRLVVREFEREEGDALGVLVFNPRGCEAGPPGDSLLDNAARLAASLVRCALRQGRTVRLAFARGGDMVDLAVEDLDAAREELASLAGDGELDAGEMLRRAEEGLPAGSDLLVVAPLHPGHPEWLEGLHSPRVRAGLLLLDAVTFSPGESGKAGPEGAPKPPGPHPVPEEALCVLGRGDDLGSCFPGSWQRIGA
jgi:uncharacterized protein (DUF58 family)